MKNIIIFGMKNCGKSTLAKRIAAEYKCNCIHIDQEIERAHATKTNEKHSYREIFKTYGKEYFTKLEKEIINSLSNTIKRNTVIDCSGSSPLSKENRKNLRKIGITVWLKTDLEVNYQRLIKNGIPAFFQNTENPKDEFRKIWKLREKIYKEFADYELFANDENADELIENFKLLNIIN
jgi:shikimate kinase